MITVTRTEGWAANLEVRCPYCNKRVMDMAKGDALIVPTSEYGGEGAIVADCLCKCHRHFSIVFLPRGILTLSS